MIKINNKGHDIMDKLLILGAIPFKDQFDKKKKIFKLKTEYGTNLIYRIEDNFINYESHIFQ